MTKRTDLLSVIAPNAAKMAAVAALVAAFRSCAPAVRADQFRRLFETGYTAKDVSAANEALSPGLVATKAAIGAQRTQMLRYQVTGQIESWLSNRANEVVRTLMSASLKDDLRREALTISKWRLWFAREEVLVREAKLEAAREAAGPSRRRKAADRGDKPKQPSRTWRNRLTVFRSVSPEGRALARQVMKAVMKRHRRPSVSGVSPWIDKRQAIIVDRTKNAGTACADMMVGIMALDGKRRWLPVKTHAHHRSREGERANTVQLIERRDHRGAVSFEIGVVTDQKAHFAAMAKAYAPKRETLALDVGIATMIASDAGDLMGRDWRIHLERHDRRISGLAANLQRMGVKPNRSHRYRARIASFRGFLRTEINRLLERLVRVRAPKAIVIERLDFRAPRLSRRLNRLLARMGHGLIKAKLDDLKAKLGIAWTQVNPAYSSQTCSSCGHVQKTNRESQARFACRSCGTTLHADVNGARNLVAGCSAFDRAAVYGKEQALRLTARRHLERIGVAFENDRASPDLSRWRPGSVAWVGGRPKAYERNGYYRPFFAGIDFDLLRSRKGAPLVAA